MNVRDLHHGDVVRVKLDPPGPGTDEYWRRYGVEFDAKIMSIDPEIDGGYVDVEIEITDDNYDDWLEACGMSADEIDTKVGDEVYLPDVPARSVLRVLVESDPAEVALEGFAKALHHMEPGPTRRRLLRVYEEVAGRMFP